MATYTTVGNVNLQVTYLGSVTIITSADRVAFIEDAESVVNLKLAQIYTIPFSPVPPVIQMITTKVATYNLMQSYGFKDNEEKAGWMDRFKEAERLLDDIAAGKYTLTVSGGTVVNQKTTNITVSSTRKDYNPVFDMRDVIYQRVDPDLIDDEDDKDS